LSFTNARPATVKGNVNKNFPPIANKTAKITNIIIVSSLSPLDILLTAALENHLNKKYKITKINSV
jgi:hypothetical protein